ncbi:PorV/PorQ family protein [candidate division KSB1 bacterium]|nr:PorV/PorQ family protein [candidate division KSB1 bacterium]RQW00659.1 MAG: PorV/PorQ family protein [candidate division KSB1 bacterium]
MKKHKVVLYFLDMVLLCVLATNGFGQSGGATNEYGGTTDIFDYPVGARAMALGGAYVTAADDPFSLYWNPATLENVKAMSIGFYHTGLSGGTQYDFLSYVYPTISFGSFAAGVLRLALSDIPNRARDASYLGSQDYSRTLYMVGYGKYLFKWLSIGATAKIEHLNTPGYFDELSGSLGSYSESAVGGDFGLIFSSPFSRALLRNWLIGFNYQNVIQRSVQLSDKKEYSPRNFRFGLSRKFYIGNGTSHFLFAFESDNTEAKYVPNYLHFGGEFGFKEIFMLRVGYNKRGSYADGYGMTYGAGIRYLGFQLDYSYWSGVDMFFEGSHRISVSANIGKTREQKITDREARELERIQEEARKSREEERRNIFYTGMAQAREYFEKADYPRAFSAINRVLVLDDGSNGDLDFQQARDLAAQIDEAIKRQQQLALENEIAKTKQELEIQQQQQLIREHYDKAMAFWEDEQYREAIVECDRALQYDPNDKAVLDLRKMADDDLRNKINDLLSTANDLYKNNRTFDALKYYNDALPLASGIEEVESFIQGRINLLDNQLSFQNLIRRAVDYENSRQWEEAAELYQQALRSKPNNAELQRKYKEAHARANARQMEMTPEVARIYTMGVRAFRDEKFDEAIKYYEQALDKQPLNKTILNALDYARNQKRRANIPSETN